MSDNIQYLTYSNKSISFDEVKEKKKSWCLRATISQLLSSVSLKQGFDINMHKHINRILQKSNHMTPQHPRISLPVDVSFGKWEPFFY